MSLITVACSDDSDDGITDSDPADSKKTGIFLDSEVSGLTVQSGTDAPVITYNGSFLYTPGQPLTFSIGGVNLGTLADGSDIITPYDFPVPLNVARFIQSMDFDGDPTNGIDLFAASIALAGQNVPSSVFEIANSTDFENDAAIISALAAFSVSLLDETTANNNLEDGTDNTFDPAEFDGALFTYVDETGIGRNIVLFEELENPGDSSGTGFSAEYENSRSAGGNGEGDEFDWVIDANGVMSITDEDGGGITLTRFGGSSRSITIVVEEDGVTETLTLVKSATITATDFSGAPITQNGTSTRTIDVVVSSGTIEIVFKSDGTYTGSQGLEVFSGIWSVNELAPNTLLLIDGNNTDLAPNDWTIVVITSGIFAINAGILVIDVTYTGTDIVSGEIELVWEEFTIGAIFPN